jgi:predicted ArsR family transcriptional regulator
MRQGNLFESPARTALARSGDFWTSVVAARMTEKDLNEKQAWVYQVVLMATNRTVNELAEHAQVRDPRSIGRRMNELVKKGVVRVHGTRICRVTGRPAQTYEVVK